jgi:hypothetical protein
MFARVRPRPGPRAHTQASRTLSLASGTNRRGFDRAHLGALYAGQASVTGLSKALGVERKLRRQARAEAAGE